MKETRSGHRMLKIYNQWSDVPASAWDELYSLGASYNLSREWCVIWSRFYGGKGRIPYVVTIWDNGLLQLLAPFYLVRNTLLLVGSEPDLFDEFGVLCRDRKYVNDLVRHLGEVGYQFDFRFINTRSELATQLVRELRQKSIGYAIKEADTKPEAGKEPIFRKNVITDIKRCRNNARKTFGAELEFVFATERRPECIADFIRLHKKRWQGGPFALLRDLDRFITGLFMDTELLQLSMLSVEGTGRVLAYHLGYVGSDGILYSNAPAYDPEFARLSPGKMLLYELLASFPEKGMKGFDFGRGAEPYKYWFAETDTLLFSLGTGSVCSPLGRIAKKLGGWFAA